MGLAKKFKACFSYAAMTLALAVVGPAFRSLADELATKAEGTTWAPMLVGGWELSPTLFAGAVYNSNVNQRPTNPDASWGERITPSFTANLDNGIHKTRFYGVADIQNYANNDVTTKTTVNANVGFTQTYLPTPDLAFRFMGNFTRASNVFGNSAFSTVNTPLSSTPSAPVATTVVSPQVNSNPSNQFTGAVSVDKSFGLVFVGLTTTAVNTQNNSYAAGMTSTNGTTYTVTERTGFNLTPQIYAFVDPSVNWQRYTDSKLLNSNGYRLTGGVGTRAVGNWRGEIYGGYQAQNNDIVGTYSSPVLGLRIGYSPTRMWDFDASVDENLGAPTATTIGSTAGVATEITTALLNVGYKGLPQDWTTSARFGFVHTIYIASPRIDNGWLTGARVTYEFWRNLGITLDYQYESLESNAPLSSFNQHMVTLGASYKY